MGRESASDLPAGLAALPLWSGPISISELPGGMTNRNLLLEAPEGRFVVRVAVVNTVHNIDREAERRASIAASRAGLGPELVWSEPGFMIMRHVEGRTLVQDDFSREATLIDTVSLLRRIYRSMPLFYEGPLPDRRPLSMLKHYAANLKALGGRWRSGIEHHLPYIGKVAPLLPHIPLGFAHNDVHGDNLIDDGVRVWLIDWEYAGQGQPMADIASLANNARLSDAAADAALLRWLARPIDEHDRTDFAAMRLATALRDLFWGYAQDSQTEQPQVGLENYIGINEARVKAAAARL